MLLQIIGHRVFCLQPYGETNMAVLQILQEMQSLEAYMTIRHIWHDNRSYRLKDV